MGTLKLAGLEEGANTAIQDMTKVKFEIYWVTARIWLTKKWENTSTQAPIEQTKMCRARGWKGWKGNSSNMQEQWIQKWIRWTGLFSLSLLPSPTYNRGFCLGFWETPSPGFAFHSFLLDAIASPSTSPCQSVGGSLIVSDFRDSYRIYWACEVVCLQFYIVSSTNMTIRPFLRPVDAVKEGIFPDYYQVVTRPMCLDTVEKRLRSGWYWDSQHCIRDIQQVKLYFSSEYWYWYWHCTCTGTASEISNRWNYLLKSVFNNFGRLCSCQSRFLLRFGSMPSCTTLPATLFISGQWNWRCW